MIHFPSFRLTPPDAHRYVRFRRRMLEDAQWAFGADPDDDLASAPERVALFLARDDNAVVAVADGGDGDRGNRGDRGNGGELVAAAGIRRIEAPKVRHRAMLWGMFVAPERRGEGLARAVLEAALAIARGWEGVD